MNDEQDGESYRVVAWILAIAVSIAIVTAVLPGILLAINPGWTTAATALAAPAAATSPTVPVAGPAKIFFDSGKISIPSDSTEKFKPIVDAIKSGSASRVVVSGYHDKTGSPEQNAELAKNRAKAVRDELIRAGLAEAQLELQKPQEASASSNDQEARRVEVTAFK